MPWEMASYSGSGNFFYFHNGLYIYQKSERSIPINLMSLTFSGVAFTSPFVGVIDVSDELAG